MLFQVTLILMCHHKYLLWLIFFCFNVRDKFMRLLYPFRCTLAKACILPRCQGGDLCTQEEALNCNTHCQCWCSNWCRVCVIWLLNEFGPKTIRLNVERSKECERNGTLVSKYDVGRSTSRWLGIQWTSDPPKCIYIYQLTKSQMRFSSGKVMAFELGARLTNFVPD